MPKPKQDTPVIQSPAHLAVDWTKPFTTEDLELAVGLLTIGIPFKVKRIRTVIKKGNAKEQTVTRYQFASKATIAQIDGQPLVYQTKYLLKLLLHDGVLESDCPGHPLCYTLQALLNHKAIVKHARGEAPLFCFRKAGADGITALVHDRSEQSFDSIYRHFQTTRPMITRNEEDLRPPRILPQTQIYPNWDQPKLQIGNRWVAAAIATIGIPFNITVPGSHEVYEFAGKTTLVATNGHEETYDAHALYQDLTNTAAPLDIKDPEHPLCYTMQALLNRKEHLKDHDKPDLIHFMNTRLSGRAAMIHDGNTASIDMVRRHYLKSGRHYNKQRPL